MGFGDFEEGGGGKGGEDDDEGEEGVTNNLKEAFGTDFKVDTALINAILRGNCIAFVGAGFSQNETKMTWDDLIEELLVMFAEKVWDGRWCVV